jgi:hypothetical protein
MNDRMHIVPRVFKWDLDDGLMSLKETLMGSFSLA